MVILVNKNKKIDKISGSYEIPRSGMIHGWVNSIVVLIT
jgi:hypothetical protein